jgi:hypothetical protein
MEAPLGERGLKDERFAPRHHSKSGLAATIVVDMRLWELALSLGRRAARSNMTVFFLYYDRKM